MLRFVHVVIIFSYSSLVSAWSEHGLLTKAALKNQTELQQKDVIYKPLIQVLPAMNLFFDEIYFGATTVQAPNAKAVLTPEDLNLYLMIKRKSIQHTGFSFEPRLRESKDQILKAADVISYYTDEPDGWKDSHTGEEPDTNLFDDDQYGDKLWKPEYAMMGGREGTSSQAFRHMWWSPWDKKHPVATIKFPFSHIKNPMGSADERIDIYRELSRAASKAGSPYWQMRFIANALHYIQDCTQPFHVSQTPSKNFIIMASPAGRWSGSAWTMSATTKRTTKVVEYYHVAYESFIGKIFSNPADFPGSFQRFSTALTGDSSLVEVPSAGDYLQQIARQSVVRAPIAAQTAMDFFPVIPKSYDLTSFEPQTFMDDSFWKAVRLNAQNPSRAKDNYYLSVEESFRLFGVATRSLIRTELGH